MKHSIENILKICIFTLLIFTLFGCSKSSSNRSPDEGLSNKKEIQDKDRNKNNTLFCENNIEVIIQNLPTIKFNSKWEKRNWLTRVSKILRNGKEFNPQEIEYWETKQPTELFISLFKNPAFSNSVLDFNLFFLGIKNSTVNDKTTGLLNSTDSSALDSALNLYNDGNYFSLFELPKKYYILYFDRPFQLTPEDAVLSDSELRIKYYNRFLEYIIEQIEYIKNIGANFEWKKYCEKFEIDKNIEISKISDPYKSGLPYDLIDNIFSTGESSTDEIISSCLSDKTSTDPNFHLLNRLIKIKETWIRLFEEIKIYEKSTYHPRYVSELIPIEISRLGSNIKLKPVNFLLALTLPNSSTNYNRKRASYFLKRYYCDDLTPINFETPDEHTKDIHGSNASCMSCHYKLDPFAGYFRNYGLFFNDYSNKDNIVFDDLASTKKNKYIETWKSHNDPSMEWNVGYIRSTKNKNLNNYGESIEDMFANFKKAPEVKRCLMKRLFEYVTSEEQAIDGGYLDFITKEFEIRSTCNSSLAMKEQLARILMSETFKTTNRDSDECFDFAPGDKPQDLPPCKINNVLKKNCMACHNTVDGQNNLDLSRWKKHDNGEFNFPHFDKNGIQISKKQTLHSLLERINTTDSKLIMPKNRFMTPVDRAELYNWILSEFNK